MDIDDYIREQILARTQIIEAVIKKVLQGSTCGVKAV